MSLPATLGDRGAEYFGQSNTKDLQRVYLGHGKVAFVGLRRLWIYDEEFGRRGIAINLTPTMREKLLDALGVEVPA